MNTMMGIKTRDTKNDYIMREYWLYIYKQLKTYYVVYIEIHTHRFKGKEFIACRKQLKTS